MFQKHWHHGCFQGQFYSLLLTTWQLVIFSSHFLEFWLRWLCLSWAIGPISGLGQNPGVLKCSASLAFIITITKPWRVWKSPLVSHLFMLSPFRKHSGFYSHNHLLLLLLFFLAPRNEEEEIYYLIQSSPLGNKNLSLISRSLYKQKWKTISVFFASTHERKLLYQRKWNKGGHHSVALSLG